MSYKFTCKQNFTAGQNGEILAN